MSRVVLSDGREFRYSSSWISDVLARKAKADKVRVRVKTRYDQVGLASKPANDM